MTVSYISTPSTLVGLLSALIVELYHAGLVVAVCLLVLDVSAAESNVLVEAIGAGYFPSTEGIFLAVLAVTNLLHCIILERIRGGIVVSSRAGSLAKAIGQSNALEVSCLICGIVSTCIIQRRITLQIEAASKYRSLEFVTKRHSGTRSLIIEHQGLVIGRCHAELTELRLEVLVVALCPYALQADFIGISTESSIVFHIRAGIETCLYMPVGIDLSRRLETKQHLIFVGTLHILIARARVRVTSLAVPLYLVSVLFEVCYADAEVVELIGELSGQFVDQRLVAAADIRLGHSLGDHLRHLIARDVLVALERRVAVAFDDAISGQLAYCIISPVVSRYIGERIGSSKRRAGCADNECRSQCGYKSLFHEKFLPI